MLLLSAFH